MAEHIKIGDIRPRIQYAGDGEQTVFTYPFPIFTDTDIQVFVGETLQTNIAHYTVAGAGADTGGTITLATAPPNGDIVTLVRNLTVKRETDFQESGEFRAKVINDELDKIIAMIQEIEDALGRGLFLSATDTASTLTLPSLANRAGSFLAFDADGDPIAASDPGGYPASAFMATVLDDPDSSTARTTLGLVIGTDVLAPGGDGSALTGITAGNAWGDPVDADVVPDTDSARDLGSAVKAFSRAYLDTILPVGVDTSIKRLGGAYDTPIANGLTKAWAAYDMASATLSESMNISSSTDNGSGDTTLGFTNAMANADWVADGIVMDVGVLQVAPDTTHARAATDVRFRGLSASFTPTDRNGTTSMSVSGALA